MVRESHVRAWELRDFEGISADVIKVAKYFFRDLRSSSRVKLSWYKISRLNPSFISYISSRVQNANTFSGTQDAAAPCFLNHDKH